MTDLFFTQDAIIDCPCCGENHITTVVAAEGDELFVCDKHRIGVVL